MILSPDHKTISDGYFRYEIESIKCGSHSIETVMSETMNSILSMDGYIYMYIKDITKSDKGVLNWICDNTYNYCLGDSVIFSFIETYFIIDNDISEVDFGKENLNFIVIDKNNFFRLNAKIIDNVVCEWNTSFPDDDPILISLINTINSTIATRNE